MISAEGAPVLHCKLRIETCRHGANEEAKVDDYQRLSLALNQLRLMGVRLAIERHRCRLCKSGHILKLAPDFIKLDRELTSGIDTTLSIALATALVSFASKLGAEIIAGDRDWQLELEVLWRWEFVTDRGTSSAGRRQST